MKNILLQQIFKRKNYNNVFFNYKKCFLSENITKQKILKKFDAGIVRRDDFIKFLEILKTENTTNDKSIAHNNFLKYYQIATSKGLINHITYSELMPIIISFSSSLEINSNEFWKITTSEFSKNYHKIGINLCFQILADFDYYYLNNPNVIHLKNIYFRNLTKDKVLSFNLECIVSYLNIYKNLHSDQNLLKDIHQIIIKLSSNLDNVNKVLLLKKLMPYLEKQFSIEESFSTFLILIFSKNKQSFTIDETISFLNILNQNDCKVKEFGAEEIILKNLKFLQLSQVIELLNLLSNLNLGSSELYLKFEKIIGSNISEIKPRFYLAILNNFIKSNKYREKLLILFQKFICDNKYEFNFDDICQIIKLYTDVETSNCYIYDKLFDFFLNILDHLNLEQISKVLYAYNNNKNLSSDLIAKMSQKTEKRITLLLNENNFFDIYSLIRILYVFKTNKNIAINNNLISDLIEKLNSVDFHNDLFDDNASIEHNLFNYLIPLIKLSPSSNFDKFISKNKSKTDALGKYDNLN